MDVRRDTIRNSLLCLIVLAVGCQGGSGGDETTFFEITGSNIGTGKTHYLNEPIEFYFNKPVDVASVSLASTFVVEALPAANGTPLPPVQGSFLVKEGSEGKTLVFQPLCPNAENFQWGLAVGTNEVANQYQVSLNALKSTDGADLAQPFTAEFFTPAPPQLTVRDVRPAQPPGIANTAELVSELGLNLFIQPNEPLSVLVDQHLDPATVGKDAIKVTYRDPEQGVEIGIPSETILIDSCRADGRAELLVMLEGILLAESEVFFRLNRTVSSMGRGDTNAADILFHQARVKSKPAPGQQDALLETFNDQEGMDPNPGTIYPLAKWGQGRLAAAGEFPHQNTDLILRFGKNTPNGKLVNFNSDGAVLFDQDGLPVFFPDGVINCASFILQPRSEFRVIGNNPLVVNATDRIVVGTKAILSVAGQKGLTVKTLNSANSQTPGGVGRAGGGDGGDGSPELTRASPKGQDGFGPGGIPSGGGEGGHTAYGPGRTYNRPGGGGGGTFGGLELDATGNYTAFCFSNQRYCDDCTTCPFGSGMRTYNSMGEDGANGSRARQVGPCPGSYRCCINGDGVDQIDAATGQCHAQGGKAGPATFADGDPTNNFYGRKPFLVNGEIEVLTGELQQPQGGQGGGGGGDNSPGPFFPSPNFGPKDFRGGGGGGGGGILILRAKEQILVRGTISAAGGGGGEGGKCPKIGCTGREGGGGGAGSGGMIVMSSLKNMYFDKASTVLARGGYRSFGSGTEPGERCTGGAVTWNNGCSAVGAAGGKGLIILQAPMAEGDPVSCGGAMRPKLQLNADGTRAITVQDKNLVDQQIECEWDLNVAGRFSTSNSSVYLKFDPAPHLTTPDFGSISAAQSQWYYLGQPGTRPDFQFPGVDPQSGKLDSTFAVTLASGNGAVAAEGHLVILDNPSLADLVRSEPMVLSQDRLAPNGVDVPLTIVGAEVSGTEVTLHLDPQGPSVGSVGDWDILRPYLDLQGSGDAYFQFQGAHAAAPGSNLPGVLSAPSPDITAILAQDPDMIRFSIQLEQPPSPTSTLEIRYLKLPFSF